MDRFRGPAPAPSYWIPVGLGTHFLAYVVQITARSHLGPLSLFFAVILLILQTLAVVLLCAGSFEILDFFRISMTGRNEHNGIIFAGTMGLIRRDILERLGGWDEWCITEDAEISLRILDRGYEGIYVQRSFGHGLMPLNFEGLKNRRVAWGVVGLVALAVLVFDLAVTLAPEEERIFRTNPERLAFVPAALLNTPPVSGSSRRLQGDLVSRRASPPGGATSVSPSTTGSDPGRSIRRVRLRARIQGVHERDPERAVRVDRRQATGC